MNIARPIHGKLLAATGVVHTLFGLLPFAYGREWLAFAREGFVNVVMHRTEGPLVIDYPREAAFWFMFVGPTLIILGDLVHHVERTLGEVPKRFAWSILALAIVSMVMMPFSGFVLLLPQAVWLAYRVTTAKAEARERQKGAA